MLIDITCQVSGGLPWSNLIHINLELIHSLLFPMEPKQNLFTKAYFHIKVNIFLKYLDWFVSAVLSIPCLLATVICLLINNQKIQNQHNNIQDPGSLCIFHCCVAYSFLYYFISLFQDFTSLFFKLFLSMTVNTNMLSFLHLCTL